MKYNTHRTTHICSLRFRKRKQEEQKEDAEAGQLYPRVHSARCAGQNQRR